jgi:hypothetical protein
MSGNRLVVLMLATGRTALTGDADQIRAALQGGAGELADAADGAGAGADSAAEEPQDIQTTATGRASVAGHFLLEADVFCGGGDVVQVNALGLGKSVELGGRHDRVGAHGRDAEAVSHAEFGE